MKLSTETSVFFRPSYAMMGREIDIFSDPMITRTEEDATFQKKFKSLMDETANQSIPENISKCSNSLAVELFKTDEIQEHLKSARVNSPGSDQMHSACALIGLIDIFSQLYNQKDQEILIKSKQDLAQLLIACINVYIRVFKNGGRY